MENQNIKQTDLIKPNTLNDGLSHSDLPVSVPTDIPSSDVFTSYIFSTSSRSLSKYGERLLMEVISVAQEYTIDAALGIHKLDFGEKYKEKFAKIDIPVKSLLNSDDTTNYTKAKEAAVELMKIYHTVEAPVLDADGKQMTYKDGSPQYKFTSYHLLDKVDINEKPGIVSVKLGEETWSQILDMGKGYTRYNLLTAKKLNDVVAIRLFQIMSNSSTPQQFSIERIKGILGLQDKYVNNTAGFLRRVIDPAEAEIKEKCPFEVVHELKFTKAAGKGRPSVSGIIFSKVMKPSVISSPDTSLPSGLIDILINRFGFDARGIRSNIKLFQDIISSGHDIEAFLLQIEHTANQAKNPCGYVIIALRNLLSGKNSSLSVNQESKPADSTKVEIMHSTKSVSSKKSSKKGRLSVSSAEAFNGAGLEEI